MGRQFLAANPGSCFSNISNTLRKEADGGNLLSRISWFRNAMPNSPTQIQIGINYSPTKQCVACSQGMYHSTLYDLPWVIRCPLHNLPLVAKCPKCKLPWPRLDEMKNRKCSFCSLPAISEINTDQLLPCDKAYYDPVERLTYLVHSEASEPSPYLYCMERGKHYLKKMPYHDKYSSCFPYIRMYENCKVNAQFLASLPIEYTKAPHKITSRKDIAIDGQRDLSIWDMRKGGFNAHEQSDQQWMLKLDYCALNTVLKWTAQVVGRRHKVHIMSSRFLTHQDFARLPTLCPYCLAISLWFLKIAVSKYEVGYRIQFNNHPFMEYAGFNFGNTWNEPIVEMNSNWYTLGTRFRKWFYFHRLMVDFREIYHFVIWYQNSIKKYKDDIRQLYYKQYITDTPDPYKYYLADNNNRILVFYNSTSPLSLISLKKKAFAKNACIPFYNQLKKGVEPHTQIYFDPAGDHVTFSEFTVLHKKIEPYLYSMQSYCRGSEPIHIR